jgi:site-specific DNA recombinase
MTSKIYSVAPLSKRACIYIRVSTEEQGNNYSPEFQEREMLAWAERNGYQVNPRHIYRDIGYSGASKIEERKACPELFAAAERKEFDLVMTWRVDRFFRKILYLLQAIEKLNNLGIHFVSVTEGIDTANKFSKPSLTLMGLGAELERDGILERTAEGRKTAARSGKWVGGKYPPYGYDINEDRVMTINPFEAEVVRSIFDWFVTEGISTYQIQQRLHKRHIPTKADSTMDEAKRVGKDIPKWRKKNPANFWGHSTIVKLLKQEAYTGQYHYGKRAIKKDSATGKRIHTEHPRHEWISLACPSIIDLPIWQKAQQRLAHNMRFARRNKKFEYLFSGKILCGCCQSSYVGYTKKKFKRKECVATYGQYRCRKSNKAVSPEQCRNIQVSERELEKRIWPQIHAFLSNPKRFLQELQARELKQAGAIELRTQQKEITDGLDSLQKEHERAVYMFEKGIHYQRPGEIDARLEEIEKERESMKKRQDSLSGKILTREERQSRLRSAEDLSQRFKTAIDNADFATRMEVIQTLVEKITMHPKRIWVTLRIEKPLPEEPRSVDSGENRIQKLRCGADGENRTLTRLLLHAPEACASTNSATSAR